jgi:transcriptional regulator with XRE-family HTH domain
MSLAGLNLKYLRKLRGWTQEEFASKLNIKRSLLGAYEEERADTRL